MGEARDRQPRNMNHRTYKAVGLNLDDALTAAAAAWMRATPPMPTRCSQRTSTKCAGRAHDGDCSPTRCRRLRVIGARARRSFDVWIDRSLNLKTLRERARLARVSRAGRPSRAWLASTTALTSSSGTTPAKLRKPPVPPSWNSSLNRARPTGDRRPGGAISQPRPISTFATWLEGAPCRRRPRPPEIPPSRRAGAGTPASRRPSTAALRTRPAPRGARRGLAAPASCARWRHAGARAPGYRPRCQPVPAARRCARVRAAHSSCPRGARAHVRAGPCRSSSSSLSARLPARPRGADGGREPRLVDLCVGVVPVVRERGPEQALRQPRQPGAVCGQVLQRDLAAAHRQPQAGGQVALDRVVQRHDPRAGHVRKKRCGERLRDRADLEDRGRTIRQPPATPVASLAARLDCDHQPGVSHAAVGDHLADAVCHVARGHRPEDRRRPVRRPKTAQRLAVLQRLRVLSAPKHVSPTRLLSRLLRQGQGEVCARATVRPRPVPCKGPGRGGHSDGSSHQRDRLTGCPTR